MIQHMPADRAIELAQKQTPGVKYIVGPTEAICVPVDPLPEAALRQLPGTRYWMRYKNQPAATVTGFFAERAQRLFGYTASQEEVDWLQTATIKQSREWMAELRAEHKQKLAASCS